METGDVIISCQGRDKGRLMLIISICPDKGHVYVADGRLRRIENPKLKRIKHVKQLPCDRGRTAERLALKEKVTNSELRKAIIEIKNQLALVRAELTEEEVHG